MPQDYKPLTPKQARFVECYLRSLNASAAAVEAGYAPGSARVTGSRLLTNKAVARAIAEAMEARSRETKIDSAWVLKQLREVAERCMGEVKPALDRKGRQITNEDGAPLYTFNAAAANRALELIGKHVNVGAFSENINLNASVSIIDRLLAGRARARQKYAPPKETENE